MKKSIGIIGCGNMGEAILKGVRRKYKVVVCEGRPARRRYLHKQYRLKARSLDEVIAASKILILAVKPQDIESVLAKISEQATKNHLIISIAAGITTQYLEKKLGRDVRVVRTMPNMPAQIGEGITAICKGKYAKQNDIKTAANIFGCVGDVLIAQEKHIDAVTAVSGSGPAYVFLFAECLLDAARSVGLSPQQSRELVMKTLLGSVNQMTQLKSEPAQLRAKVTSKGGTTQAALNVFSKNKFKSIFKDAVKAAQKRAKQLSRS